MKESFFKKIENFELHHRVMIFVCLIILTILVTRGLVLIKDPNPTVFGFELHHFDYGLLLLLAMTILLLFGERKHLTYLVGSAVAIGLILDNLWFIRLGVKYPVASETQIYNSTFFATII